MYFTSIYNYPWFVAQLPFSAAGDATLPLDSDAGIFNPSAVIAAAILVVGMAIAVIYFVRRNRPVGAKNHRKLFNDLCRAHHLSGAERKQIRNLASRLQIPSPTILFLDHSLWDFDKLAQGDHPLADREIENLKKLSRILFVSAKVKPNKLALT